MFGIEKQNMFSECLECAELKKYERFVGFDQNVCSYLGA